MLEILKTIPVEIEMYVLLSRLTLPVWIVIVNMKLNKISLLTYTVLMIIFLVNVF